MMALVDGLCISLLYCMLSRIIPFSAAYIVSSRPRFVKTSGLTYRLLSSMYSELSTSSSIATSMACSTYVRIVRPLPMALYSNLDAHDGLATSSDVH
ncbi:hypothetical protein C8Q76DRAFT_466987 [Earliella scabrosa]|nr:hypothetical protein C8Q76DRAFT_466987 [Earliella scabrosa]